MLVSFCMIRKSTIRNPEPNMPTTVSAENQCIVLINKL
ncbi:hypothetical protein D051_0275 [Vibrio parahaemolyticus VPCR-2010]|nr:hypothetical protein D051_0275 [Vibrio parahaemolyticus VPCR-2010]